MHTTTCLNTSLGLIEPEVLDELLLTILKRLGEQGFDMVKHRVIRPKLDQVRAHYFAERKKDYFTSLVDSWVGRDTFVFIVQRHNAVNALCKLVGPLPVEERQLGTIRGDHLLPTDPPYRRIVDCSNAENLQSQIAIWFPCYMTFG